MTWHVSEMDVEGWYWWICLAVVSFWHAFQRRGGACYLKGFFFYFFILEIVRNILRH